MSVIRDNLDALIDAGMRSGFSDVRLIGAGFVRGIGAMSREEALDAAIQGFVQASGAYDPTLGAFSTLVYKCQDFARKRVIYRRRTPKGRAIRSTVNEAPPEAKRAGWHSNAVPDRCARVSVDEAAHREDCADLAAAMSSLLPRWRHVIEGVYYRGLDRVAVAKELGVTRQRVNQIETDALAAIRKNLAAIRAHRVKE